ncbi:hypothetical protein ABK040_000294 [Willaertia magna]
MKASTTLQEHSQMVGMEEDEIVNSSEEEETEEMEETKESTEEKLSSTNKYNTYTEMDIQLKQISTLFYFNTPLQIQDGFIILTKEFNFSEETLEELDQLFFNKQFIPLQNSNEKSYLRENTLKVLQNSEEETFNEELQKMLNTFIDKRNVVLKYVFKREGFFDFNHLFSTINLNLEKGNEGEKCASILILYLNKLILIIYRYFRNEFNKLRKEITYFLFPMLDKLIIVLLKHKLEIAKFDFHIYLLLNLLIIFYDEQFIKDFIYKNFKFILILLKLTNSKRYLIFIKNIFLLNCLKNDLNEINIILPLDLGYILQNRNLVNYTFDCLQNIFLNRDIGNKFYIIDELFKAIVKNRNEVISQNLAKLNKLPFRGKILDEILQIYTNPTNLDVDFLLKLIFSAKKLSFYLNTFLERMDKNSSRLISETIPSLENLKTENDMIECLLFPKYSKKFKNYIYLAIFKRLENVLKIPNVERESILQIFTKNLNISPIYFIKNILQKKDNLQNKLINLEILKYYLKYFTIEISHLNILYYLLPYVNNYKLFNLFLEILKLLNINIDYNLILDILTVFNKYGNSHSDILLKSKTFISLFQNDNLTNLENTFIYLEMTGLNQNLTEIIVKEIFKLSTTTNQEKEKSTELSQKLYNFSKQIFDKFFIHLFLNIEKNENVLENYLLNLFVRKYFIYGMRNLDNFLQFCKENKKCVLLQKIIDFFNQSPKLNTGGDSTLQVSVDMSQFLKMELTRQELDSLPFSYLYNFYHKYSKNGSDNVEIITLESLLKEKFIQEISLLENTEIFLMKIFVKQILLQFNSLIDCDLLQITLQKDPKGLQYLIFNNENILNNCKENDTLLKEMLKIWQNIFPNEIIVDNFTNLAIDKKIFLHFNIFNKNKIIPELEKTNLEKVDNITNMETLYGLLKVKNFTNLNLFKNFTLTLQSLQEEEEEDIFVKFTEKEFISILNKVKENQELVNFLVNSFLRPSSNYHVITLREIQKLSDRQLYKICVNEILKYYFNEENNTLNLSQEIISLLNLESLDFTIIDSKYILPLIENNLDLILKFIAMKEYYNISLFGKSLQQIINYGIDNYREFTKLDIFTHLLQRKEFFYIFYKILEKKEKAQEKIGNYFTQNSHIFLQIIYNYLTYLETYKNKNEKLNDIFIYFNKNKEMLQLLKTEILKTENLNYKYKGTMSIYDLFIFEFIYLGNEIILNPNKYSLTNIYKEDDNNNEIKDESSSDNKDDCKKDFNFLIHSFKLDDKKLNTFTNDFSFILQTYYQFYILQDNNSDKYDIRFLLKYILYLLQNPNLIDNIYYSHLLIEFLKIGILSTSSTDTYITILGYEILSYLEIYYKNNENLITNLKLQQLTLFLDQFKNSIKFPYSKVPTCWTVTFCNILDEVLILDDLKLFNILFSEYTSYFDFKEFPFLSKNFTKFINFTIFSKILQNGYKNEKEFREFYLNTGILNDLFFYCKENGKENLIFTILQNAEKKFNKNFINENILKINWTFKELNNFDNFENISNLESILDKLLLNEKLNYFKLFLKILKANDFYKINIPFMEIFNNNLLKNNELVTNKEKVEAFILIYKHCTNKEINWNNNIYNFIETTLLQNEQLWLEFLNLYYNNNKVNNLLNLIIYFFYKFGNVYSLRIKLLNILIKFTKLKNIILEKELITTIEDWNILMRNNLLNLESISFKKKSEEINTNKEEKKKKKKL